MKRSRYIDYLRVAATIGVVLWHSTSNVYYKFGPLEEWIWANAMFGFIVRWSVPCFVMLSGALLLSRDEDITTFYKKRMLRIFIPLIGWTILYGLARLYYFKVYTYEDLNAEEPSVLRFLFGQFKALFFNDLSYHLYFVSIILGLYLIAPFTRILVKNLARRQVELLLLFCFVIISLKQFYNNILFVSHFQFGSSFMYFLLGYYLHTYELNKKWRTIIYLVGGFVIITMTYGNYSLEYSTGRHGDFLYQYDGIFVIILSTLIFTAFRYGFPAVERKGKWLGRLFSKLAVYSYGIYICHPLVISFLWYGGGSLYSFNQWRSTIVFSEGLKVIFKFHGAWGAAVMTIIVFSVSTLFLSLAEKMKVIKYLS